jgi:Cu+-exporting ATPase
LLLRLFKEIFGQSRGLLNIRKSAQCLLQSIQTDISDASSQAKEESAVVTPKGCGCGSKPVSDAEKTTFIDPVCGMTVTDLSKPHTEWQGQNYYFCSEKCLQKFIATPEAYVKAEVQICS